MTTGSRPADALRTGRPAGWSSRAGGVLVILVLVAAAILLAVLWKRQERAALKEWKRLLLATADEQKSAVESFLDDKATDAAVVASFPSVVALAGKDGGEGPEDVEHLRAVLEKARAAWASGSITLLGTDLRSRVHAGDVLPGEIGSLLTPAAPPGRRIGFVDSPGGRRLLVARPVRDDLSGGHLGWIVLVEDPADILWKILSRRPAASATGESLLVGRERGEIVFLSPLRQLRPGAHPDGTAVRADALAARHALEGRVDFGEFRDYRGEEVLAAVRRFEGREWGLVVKVDRAEALSGVAKNRAWSAVVLLSCALALAAVLWAVRSAERLRVAAELQQKDERHRLVLAQVRDAVVWAEPGGGRILEANRAAETLWGFSRSELLARSVLDLWPEGNREEARRKLALARQGGSLFRDRFRRRDGSLVSAEVSSQGLVLEGEEVVVSVVRDVSENEAALERIRFLNRILRTISAVDQILVGGHDRETVLRRTCEEIVASGGFTLAWFGAAGEGGRVVPVAAAGSFEGYLEEVAIRTDDSPGGRGPTGTALREGRTVVVDDWETDPIVEPWRATGLRRGYRTSAACPVRSGESILGALSLYSTQPGAFGPDAVLLLEELAGDLGLALGLIEADAMRRRAEGALAESEARYRKLFEDNPAPMWVFDVETLRFLAVNDAAVSLYGYSREEFLGRTLQDIRPVEDAAAVELDVRVERAGARVSGPWRHLRKDGSSILVQIQSHDLTFEGRPARLILVTDVTERLSAEEKLRAFFDSGMAGTIFGDVHGNVFAANDEFLRIVGYTREDLEAGRLRWTDITPPEWIPLDAERIAQARQRGVCRPYEKEYVRKDGSRVPVLVGFALVGAQREESVAFILDQTQRKASERALQASEERFKSFLNWLPAAAFVKDGALRVLWANRFLEVLLGVGPLQGRATHDAVPGPAGRRMEEDDERVLRGETVDRTEELPGPEGDLHVFRTLKFPVPGGEGQVWVGGISHDVTEQVRAEEEVRRLNAELEERVERRTSELLAKTKELEAFAYSISHDLRAPLRAINGFSKMLEEDQAARLDEEGRRLLGVVRENARRMGRLIDDLLSFSRAGRHDLRRTRVDAGAMVESVLGELLGEQERKGSDLVIGELPPVDADPALLRQVFVNLLSNAIKFSATRPRRMIGVSGRREAGRVVYEVFDNGVGFDMRYAGNLFGVFQRLHGREFEGTGVGLALVERIVSRHDGTVRAEAETDRGARFTISFPDGGEMK